MPQELASKFHSAQTAINSERKLVSIIFADLSGFTALSEGEPPVRVWCPLAGEHQIENALTALVSLRRLGLYAEAIERGIASASE